MKRSIICSLLLTFTVVFTNAQGIEFFEGTWQEALAEAKKQEKVIFVDAYATWCGPCKRMSKSVFPNRKVGDFYNKNFINMKLDMERGEGLKFRKEYPVSAFPTLFYIDYTGKIVQKVKGARDVDGFIQLGKKALSQIDRTEDFEAAYNEGNRDPELVYNYVKALNQAGKPSIKVSNEYLQSQKDLNTPQNHKFILEAAVLADSRIFDLLIQYRKQIEAISSKEKVQEKIYAACQATARKAIEFESEDLLNEAKAKMKKHYPEEAKTFASLVEMDFCLSMKNCDQFLKASKSYANTELKEEAEGLHKLAQTIVRNFEKDPKAMKQAEQFAKSAAEQSNMYSYYLTYASILDSNGKKTAAIEAANKSLELAKIQAKGAVRNIEQFIDRLAG